MDIPKLFNEKIPAAMASNPDAIKAIGAKFQLNIGGDGGGEWFLDCSATGPKAEKGSPGGADCTVKIDAENFARLLENPQANGVKLFFTGKLKVEGNPVLATKLLKLFELMQ
jgi:putative sterol carrier protein